MQRLRILGAKTVCGSCAPIAENFDEHRLVRQRCKLSIHFKKLIARYVNDPAIAAAAAFRECTDFVSPHKMAANPVTRDVGCASNWLAAAALIRQCGFSGHVRRRCGTGTQCEQQRAAYQ